MGSQALLLVSALLLGSYLLVQLRRAKLRRRCDELALQEMSQDLQVVREEAAERSRFLNAISHDLRTPLNAIGLQTHVARMEVESGNVSGVEESLDVIERAVGSATELINQFLELASVSSPGIKVTEFDFGDILTEVKKTMIPPLGVALRCDSASLMVRTDRIKLKRIVMNLVDNAFKFTTSGAVSVNAMVDGADFQFSVSDTGCGMSEEIQKRIFDEFFQVGNIERSSRKGFGLGLSIVRGLTVNLGGTISVQSEVGRGSTFLVNLPGAAVLERNKNAEECACS